MTTGATLNLNEDDRRALQIVADAEPASITPEVFASLMWGGEYKSGTKGFFNRLTRSGLIRVARGSDDHYRLTGEGRTRLADTNSNRPQHRLMPLADLMTKYADGDEIGWDAEFNYLWSAEPDRMDSLANDIQVNGIRVPVLLGPDQRVWDGHHKIAVAYRLGVDEVPVVFALDSPPLGSSESLRRNRR